MKKKYDGIYRSLSEKYANQDAEDEGALAALPRQQKVTAKELVRLIDDAVKKLDVPLRPDARHFLMTNLSEMVIKPVAAANDSRDNQMIAKHKIQKDVERILRHSQNGVEGRKDEEVSAHGILRSVAALWDKLLINAAGIWHD